MPHLHDVPGRFIVRVVGEKQQDIQRRLRQAKLLTQRLTDGIVRLRGLDGKFDIRVHSRSVLSSLNDSFLKYYSAEEGDVKGNSLSRGLRRASSLNEGESKPSQALRASSPKGSFCHLPVSTNKAPLRGAGERSEPERVLPPRGCFRRKSARQMLFSSTTPPVKTQCRAVRRPPGIAPL